MSAPPRKAWAPAAPQAGPFCEVCKNPADYYRVDVINGDAYRRVCFCEEHLPADGRSYWLVEARRVRR